MKEIKAVINSLLAQSNIDKTEIQNLKDWKASFGTGRPFSDRPAPKIVRNEILFTNDTWLSKLKKSYA